ncbi:hypothetical protein CYMTET_48960 [Cymbomonas tetramitiformis]|uniref:Uncharacterized protein n=1 Tax=Cymbomonas tetramitiformis TaxID=36881 RepID=A0AAE0BR53_9CHLO|nr:hypothetical protein CYMTET_48960 [Cymbomonas tetramitiformis]
MLKVINGQPYEGTLAWLRVGERPFALKCKYDDGDEETLTLAQLQRYLLPDDATAPQKQAVAQAQITQHTVESAALAAIIFDSAANDSPSIQYASLPKEWDLRSRATILRAANTLMPGPWDPAHITKLARHVQQQYDNLQQAAQAPTAPLRVCHPMSNEECKRISAQAWGAQLVVTTPAEIKQLQDHILWQQGDRVWDRYAGTKSIELLRQIFAGAHLSVAFCLAVLRDGNVAASHYGCALDILCSLQIAGGHSICVHAVV